MTKDATSKLDSKGRLKIKCEICGEYHHRLEVHVARRHDIKIADYKAAHPGAATISEWASKRASKAQKRAAAKTVKVANKITKAKPAKSSEGPTPFKIGCVELFQRDRSKMSPADIAKIPPHDSKWLPGQRETEMWEAIGLGLDGKEPVYLGGPTGCGKTTGTEEILSALDWPCHRFQLHENYKVSKFIGRTSLEVDEKTGQSVTRWIDGPFTKCVRYGHVALLDEMDRAPEGVLIALQGILENKPLVIDETGEVIKPHENFRIVATGNTMGRGDDSGQFSSARVLDAATLDRFGVVYKARYPDAATEAKILVDKGGIKIADARKIVEVAHKIREAFKNETCYYELSLRSNIAWARKAFKMGNDNEAFRKASKLTVINRLEGDDAAFVDGLIQRFYGGEV